MDSSSMLDVRLLAELSGRSAPTTPTPHNYSTVQSELNDSVDFEALDLYRKAVSDQNVNTSYELPVHDLSEPLADARTNWAITRAEARCVKRECSAAQGYLRALRIDQELRDKRLKSLFKASERRKKWREFDIKLNENLKRARVCQEEGRLRHAARLNEEIEWEKEYRRRLGLPVFVPLFFTIEEELFPDLDPDAIQLVRRAWDSQAPEDEVFSEDFSVKITRKDLKTLAKLNWLNDEIINFYLNLIVRRSEQNGCLPKTYAFNTFFLKTLQQRGFAGVKRWTRRVDIFAFDVLLIPVHLGNHWCLAVVDFKAQEINYFDSLGGTNVGCLNSLKSYLEEEHRDKKKSEVDLSSWTLECRTDIPRQMNGSDCGVFTCVFAEFSSRRYELKFDQRIMPYYRQRMVFEICNRKLMI